MQLNVMSNFDVVSVSENVTIEVYTGKCKYFGETTSCPMIENKRQIVTKQINFLYIVEMFSTLPIV